MLCLNYQKLKPAAAALNRISLARPFFMRWSRNGRLRWPVSEEIYRLSDQPVLSVQRRAKYLLLELPEGWIIIHLGMSGSLRILTEERPPEKHDHVDLVMSNGKVLRYTDPRRFGAWLWTKELEGHNVLAHLGTGAA